MEKEEAIIREAADRWPAAEVIYPKLVALGNDLGLRRTFGTGSIELTHPRSDAVLLRLRANGYIEVPFDSMSRNKALVGASFQREIVLGLQQAGFAVKDKQAGTWPQLPSRDVTIERLNVLEEMLRRLAKRADSAAS